MPRLPIEMWTDRTCRISGRELLAFGGCNYLGLAFHPVVREAMVEGVGRWGLTTTASRETTGNTMAHEALEREAASFFGAPKAVLTTEGYTANLALGQALAGGHRHAVLDERSHSSVVHAMKAHGLLVSFFRHLDAADALRRAGERAGEGCVLMTDGVFAADGGVAPVGAMYRGLPARGVTLVIDDCHGFCTLGPRGRGVCEMDGVPLDDPRVVLTATFAKGLGCYGGIICGSDRVVDSVREVSVYRGTTPCPPPMVEAARQALRVIDREPERLARLRNNVSGVRRVLGRLSVPASHPPVPIFTFVAEPTGEMRAVESRLRELGVLVPLIDYPGGPTPWYFRLTVSAAHTAEDLERLGSCLRAVVPGV